MTTRADLRVAGPEAIVARDVDRGSCIERRTSGSTGSPLTVLTTPRDERARRLVQFRALRMAGFGPRGRLAVLGSMAPHHPRLHQRLGLYRSANILRALPIAEQIAALVALRPTLLWTYATTLRPVLAELDYRLSRVARPRGLIAVAEVLDPLTRARILADQRLALFDFYGATEAGIIASECREHHGLHVHADHVVLEAPEEGERLGIESAGVAVLTTLNATAMPLIRYRTGDVLTFPRRRCVCGSAFPLVGAPEGREGDLIVLPSGRTLTPLRFDALNGIDGVAEYQLIQPARERLTLVLVLRDRGSEGVVDEVRARMRTFLDGEPIEVETRVVDALERQGIKLPTFVSRLPERSSDS